MSSALNPSSAVSRFRGSARVRTPLHPLEQALLSVVCLHLGFLPWALGTMHPWSQLTSLSLSLLTFTLSLIPRIYRGDYALPLSGNLQPATFNAQHSQQTAGPGKISDKQYPISNHPAGPQPSAFSPPASGFRINPIPRLLKFPLFWIGLLLLAYIALQGWNPSWVWERNEKFWWLRRVTDIPWLPTSIDTPWERFNLWRQFIIYGSAWLTTCALWVGLTRRRSLETLLVFLVLNACLLAGAGFAQRVTGKWFLIELFNGRTTGSSFASFIYHNHAGAYFALLLGVAAAIGTWLFASGERAFRKSTPAGLFAVAVVFLGGTVLFTLSRGASITVALFLLAFAAWFFLRRKLRPETAGANRAVTIAVTVVFLGVIGYTSRKVDFRSVTGKFDRLIEQQTREESARSRILAFEAAAHMLGDHWVRGVGAGGFRFHFPEYIKHYPEVYQSGALFWEHAHNDWLEIPIELGATGTSLLLVGAGWWLLAFSRRPPSAIRPQLSSLRSQPSAFSPQPSAVRAPPSVLRPSPRHSAEGATAGQPSAFSSQVSGGISPLWHSLAVPIILGCGQTLLHAWFDFPFQNPAILITWLALLTISLRWLELESA